MVQSYLNEKNLERMTNNALVHFPTSKYETALYIYEVWSMKPGFLPYNSYSDIKEKNDIISLLLTMEESNYKNINTIFFQGYLFMELKYSKRLKRRKLI